MTEQDWLRYDHLADKMYRAALQKGRTDTNTADLTEEERRDWHRIQQKLVLLYEEQEDTQRQ